MSLQFEWDDQKSEANKLKHGLSFETARLVFDDPLHESVPDRVVDGEQKWKTVGMVGGTTIIVVAHTWRDDNAGETVRIVSARLATRLEREIYESGE